MKRKNISMDDVKSLALDAQVEMVMLALREKGIVNRKVLCETYEIRQLAAGVLMRSFMAHLPYFIKWDPVLRAYVQNDGAQAVDKAPNE